MGSSLYLSGGVQNTSKLTKTFAVANSFAVGDVVRYDVGSTSFVKAQADSATNSEVVGVVSEASAASFSVVYSGEIDLTSVSTLSGFSGPVLFLASSVAGGLTSNPPSAIGTVVKPLVVRNAATNQYVVTNFLGTQIGGSSTVAIDEIQPVGTIMPFAGSVIPDSWLECDGNSYAISSYPNLYAKLQNSSGDRAPAYGHVATLTLTLNGISIVAGDFIEYKTNTGAWTGTLYDSNADLVAQVLSVSTSGSVVTAVVQLIPVYSKSTKNFKINNVVFSSGGFLAPGSETGTGNYRAYNSAKAFKGTNLTFFSSAITHFNTPDLRGRFALGLNTTAIGEIDGEIANDANISSISAYTLGSEGGEEKNSLPAVSVATSGSSPNVLANVSNNQLNNMPPYTVVRYIIKATPYTRAAIIDGLDLPYNNLLVGDLRDGALRPGGSGEDLVFKTNNGVSGTERMRLSNAGRLGIATTSPRAPLDVTTSSAGIQIAYGTSSVYATIGNDTSSNSIYNAWSGHVWQNGGTEKLRLTSTGDLGIGTSSPGYTLDLTTNGTARLGSAIITPASTTINSTNTIIGGNLGINTTNPSAKLQISSTAGAARSYSTSVLNISAIHLDGSFANTTNSALTFSSGGGGGAALNFRRDGAYGTFIDFYTNNANTANAATNRMTIDTAGKVGIGDSAPTYTLDVNGGMTDMLRLKSTQAYSLVRFQDAGTASTPQIGSAGNDLLLRTNGTDRIRVTQTGVGVSTVWIPSVATFGWTRQASATRGFAAYSNAITVPGNSSETYSVLVTFPGYNYDPGDNIQITRYDGIPGNAQIVFANEEGALYSVNGVVQSGTFSSNRGWRSGGSVMYFRTA